MAVSRAERRRDREERVAHAFGDRRAAAVLDLFELLELAWHDCYGEISPPDAIIDDILLLSEGNLERLIQVTRQAIIDRRDLTLEAGERRNGR